MRRCEMSERWANEGHGPSLALKGGKFWTECQLCGNIVEVGHRPDGHIENGWFVRMRPYYKAHDREEG